MKKVVFALAVAFSALTAMAQEKVEIKPSGNVITKEVSVKSFDGIRAKGLYELIQVNKINVKWPIKLYYVFMF